MWAYIATFNGRWIEKYVVTMRFLQLDVKWINNQKFAFLNKDDEYTEGVLLMMMKNLDILYQELDKNSLRCPPNVFNPFPNKSIIGETDYNGIQARYELVMKKCKFLQSENAYLKRLIAKLSPLLQGCSYIPYRPDISEENCSGLETMYNVKLENLKDENIDNEE